MTHLCMLQLLCVVVHNHPNRKKDTHKFQKILFESRSWVGTKPYIHLPRRRWKRGGGTHRHREQGAAAREAAGL